jgi:endonuclease/exonuclease/phosphatase (EEP) superfamily protein YafD
MTRSSRLPRDVVLTCPSGVHRIRLGKGRLFWAKARCPRCRTVLDPTRLRRVGAWAASLARPASAGPIHRGLWIGSVAYLLGAIAAAALLWGLSDRWWPATVLLFGPRWVLALPLALLVPAAALFDRALLAPLTLAGLIVAGPVIGVRSGWRAFVAPESPDDDLRIVTFNAQGGNVLLLGPVTLLDSWNADVAAFQECGSALREDLRRVVDWKVDMQGSLCLATRLPVIEVQRMERAAFERAGGSGLVVTWTLELDGVPVHVTNLHLETPRAGFELIRSGRVAEGIPRVRERQVLREAELRRARDWVDRFEGPHVVLGDFNTPPESRSYRRAWEGWRNAFSHVGRGLGGTRLNGWIRARIDHVLVDDAWTVVDARTGADVGSDHLPLIATVRLRAGAGGDRAADPPAPKTTTRGPTRDGARAGPPVLLRDRSAAYMPPRDDGGTMSFMRRYVTRLP